MNHVISFLVRVTEKLLDLHLKILVAILSFFGQALVRIITDLYARLVRKPTTPAPTRRRSYERRRGNPRRR